MTYTIFCMKISGFRQWRSQDFSLNRGCQSERVKRRGGGGVGVGPPFKFVHRSMLHSSTLNVMTGRGRGCVVA